MRSSGPPSVQAIASRSPIGMRSRTSPPAAMRWNSCASGMAAQSAPFGVDADAIGTIRRALREDPATGQRAVRRDVELGETDGRATRPRSSRRPSSATTHAVRERHVFAPRCEPTPSGLDEHEHTLRIRNGGKCAHVGVAVPVDDHVVAPVADQRAQVGVDGHVRDHPPGGSAARASRRPVTSRREGTRALKARAPEVRPPSPAGRGGPPCAPLRRACPRTTAAPPANEGPQRRRVRRRVARGHGRPRHSLRAPLIEVTRPCAFTCDALGVAVVRKLHSDRESTGPPQVRPPVRDGRLLNAQQTSGDRCRRGNDGCHDDGPALVRR